MYFSQLITAVLLLPIVFSLDVYECNYNKSSEYIPLSGLCEEDLNKALVGNLTLNITIEFNWFSIGTQISICKLRTCHNKWAKCENPGWLYSNIKTIGQSLGGSCNSETTTCSNTGYPNWICPSGGETAYNRNNCVEESLEHCEFFNEDQHIMCAGKRYDLGSYSDCSIINSQKEILHCNMDKNVVTCEGFRFENLGKTNGDFTTNLTSGETTSTRAQGTTDFTLWRDLHWKNNTQAAIDYLMCSVESIGDSPHVREMIIPGLIGSKISECMKVEWTDQQICANRREINKTALVNYPCMSQAWYNSTHIIDCSTKCILIERKIDRYNLNFYGWKDRKEEMEKVLFAPSYWRPVENQESASVTKNTSWTTYLIYGAIILGAIVLLGFTIYFIIKCINLRNTNKSINIEERPKMSLM